MEKSAGKGISPLACVSPTARAKRILKPSTSCQGPNHTSQGKPHLPFQQLFRPHILGKDLPRAVTGQRSVAQVVFKEGEKWHQKQ